MSTILYEDDGFMLTQFWGGKERGQCIQLLDIDDGYVQLTKEQARVMVAEINRWLEEQDKK